MWTKFITGLLCLAVASLVSGQDKAKGFEPIRKARMNEIDGVWETAVKTAAARNVGGFAFELVLQEQFIRDACQLGMRLRGRTTQLHGPGASALRLTRPIVDAERVCFAAPDWTSRK